MAATRPVEYASWSSTIMSDLGCRLSMMYLASCGPCTLSLDTTRKNVGYLPVVRSAAVADPVMNGMPARAISGPTAATSWLPAGPTTARTFEFEVSCWVTVVAWAGLSWVSPWTIEIFVLLARLSRRTASCAKCSCSWPRNATGPVSGPSMPTEATHGLVAPLALEPPPLLLLLLAQPATASAPAAAAATITLVFIWVRPLWRSKVLLIKPLRCLPGQGKGFEVWLAVVIRSKSGVYQCRSGEEPADDRNTEFEPRRRLGTAALLFAARLRVPRRPRRDPGARRGRRGDRPGAA